ncbi:hypothetical protein DL546_008544 [Coniochaeta pulveracea]|uniref:Folliculin-interacting protein N-terminal domain-containing protein n=1 Tax=Coniochaeta pulveracea TaxID=177199 RepID=A0A420YDB3_9PEZI|nr:hypothetical protein DL546_008544 [Coniochaeta pulveracea]
MLGKLFNMGSGGAGAGTPSSMQPAPASSLESVQEDIHTRNLLFPDTQALYQHRHDQLYPLSTGSALAATSSTNAFDYSGDVELEPKDVRIIIMQDALSSVTASLLHDSQPPPAVSTPSSSPLLGSVQSFTFQDSRRTLASAHSPHLRQGAFDQRRGSIHGHGRTPSATESDSQRALREYREELTTFSSCIFGNSELIAYKRKSTKVHVVPSDTRPTDYAPYGPSASVLGDGRGSLGRASVRSSRLSQSYTSDNVPQSPGYFSRPTERKKVLITRLFPVSLPTEDDHAATPHSRFSEDSSGYPFPNAGEEGRKKAKPRPKQKRTPMYAIALVINLPQPSPASTAPRPGGRGYGSFTEQDTSFPSSLSSTRRSGWTMVGLDSHESAIGSDIEDRTDAITQHWDIIERTLNDLQSVVATNIYTKLKQTDLSSPDPFTASSFTRTPSFSGRRSEELNATMKPPKTNAKNISLLPNCLQDNRQVAGEVEYARGRIVTGLRATRVVTGQDRWGIWREEARWVAKWAGGIDQGSFFFNLLTGFLSTHTEWLQALAPAAYRRRHYIQQRAKNEEEAAIPARTIIVAHDKMAARRLVFLLSAFLPANQQLPALRAHRPSTAASYTTLSQSPPSFVVPILKEESLRRKINRRNGVPSRRVSHSRHVSLQGQSRTPSVPATLAHLTMDGRHERRPSDTASIRTAGLPFPGHAGDQAGRKASGATTTTITPDTSIPYFASARRAEVLSASRPGSSGSSAADDLKRLTRDGSVSHYGHSRTDSRQSSRWGNVISGFWGATRRRESVGSTASYVRTMSGLNDNEPSSPVRSSMRKPGNPVTIASGQDATDGAAQPDDGEPTDALKSGNEDDEDAPGRQIAQGVTKMSIHPDVAAKPKRTPDPSGAYESPVKTSINVEDGVIDVDVPFPDYLTSLESAISSPSSSGFLSTPGLGSGLDAFEQASRASIDGDIPLNVAGWLQKYHPDFILQALPAQNDLLDQPKGKNAAHRDLVEQVKTSLRAEPTPALALQATDGDLSERWVNVSSAIIADTMNFTVTRIRYLRLVKPKASTEHGTPIMSSSYASHYSVLNTPSMSPFEVQLEEQFQEERIDSFDESLIDAVERVVSLSTDVSKGTSTSSSRSTSKRRGRSNSASTQSDIDGPLSGAPAPALTVPQEVPRAQCKKVILTALEDIIRSVIDQKENEQANEDSSTHTSRQNTLRRAIRGWVEDVEHFD